MTSINAITIGKIVAPHGVRGDVRVIPLTDFPERFEQLKTARLDDGKELVVDAVRYHKQFVILKFHGKDNRNDVEALRGRFITVSREEAVPLPEGHFYVFDIIGLTVYDEQGLVLGKISDVLFTGSNDVYVVEREDQKPLLIPALKEVVLSIDITGGKMTVKLQEEAD